MSKNTVIDIHMHIIPGVDDGSGSMAESLEEIRMAVSQGTKVIFATPHSWAITNNYQQMADRFEQLKREVKKNHIPVRLYLGCEVLCYAADMEETLSRIQDGTYPTMGNSRYVLTEFGSDDKVSDVIDCIDCFINAGFVPIIAHAERYGFTTVENIKVMKEHGARVQINAFSVVNDPKERTRTLANALLKEQLVDFVGTDAHQLSHRPPVQEEGITQMSRRYTAEYTRRIVFENPMEMLIKSSSLKIPASRAWLDGIMGVITGDALGCPVQFTSREELKRGPVEEMEGHGTYDMPEGTWTDDGSLTLALLASIRECQRINLQDIMCRFVRWLKKGEYTPFGQAFDIGGATETSLIRYMKKPNVRTCGGTEKYDNGNGSLMRILPACLYAWERKLEKEEAIRIVHDVSGLTHNHLRAKIACGLYYFCVCAVLDGSGTLQERLQSGMDQGFAFYKKDIRYLAELAHYGRLQNLLTFSRVPEEQIKSSGYVVDTLEAAVWSLLTTENFRECELKAVNLGEDTDTIAAIAGGLAGLFYTYENIPSEWLEVIQKRDWIEQQCQISG